MHAKQLQGIDLFYVAVVAFLDRARRSRAATTS